MTTRAERNAMYKCYVVLKNGSTRIIRMAWDKVAHVVAEFRKLRESIFNDRVILTINGVTFTLNDVVRIIFKNERTREELLSLE